MSSESVSSGMAQKQVEFDLVDGKLVVKGIDASNFSVDCAQPKLNLRQLYKAIFSDIVEPTEILVSSTSAVENDKHVQAHFASIKKIVEDAQAEINEKLPAVLDKRARIEKSIKDDMGTVGATGIAAGLEDPADSEASLPAVDHEG